MIVSSRELLFHRLFARLEGTLLGKQEPIRQFVTALLAGGHVLLEDIPGVGKTLLAEAFARAVGGDYRRIQFTSDLMPADVVGGLVLHSGSHELVYREGPIAANIVLADEINRSSPRTQSALLEAMEERAVTVDGKTRLLPDPFMLIASQNPLAFEGTSPLPEAQLDRFMMCLSIGYPGEQDELQLLEQFASGERGQRFGIIRALPVLTVEDWKEMQQEVRHVHVDDLLLQAMVQVAGISRNSEAALLGLSPRAMRDWLRAGQAAAYISGRGYMTADDLVSTGSAVLQHRIKLRPSSSGGAMKQQRLSFIEEAVRKHLAHMPLRSSGRAR